MTQMHLLVLKLHVTLAIFYEELFIYSKPNK